MDYMDLDVRCPKKAVKLTHPLVQDCSITIALAIEIKTVLH